VQNKCILLDLTLDPEGNGKHSEASGSTIIFQYEP